MIGEAAPMTFKNQSGLGILNAMIRSPDPASSRTYYRVDCAHVELSPPRPAREDRSTSRGL